MSLSNVQKFVRPKMSAAGKSRTVTLLLLVLGSMLILFEMTGVYRAIGQPSPGFFVSEKGFMGLQLLADAELGLSRREVQLWDHLIEVDGEAFDGSAGLAKALEGRAQGSRVAFRFERLDGSQYLLEATVRKFSADRFAWGALPFGVAAILGIFACALVVLVNPLNSQARIFAFAGLMTILEIAILQFENFIVQGLTPASYLIGWLSHAAILHVGCLFPVQRWPLGLPHHRGEIMLYGVTGIMWAFLIVRFDQPTTESFDAALRLSYAPLYFLFFSPLLVNTAVCAWRAKNPAISRRARLALPAVLWILGMIPLSWLWNWTDVPFGLRVSMPASFVVASAVSIAIATLRDDVFDAGPQIRRLMTRIAWAVLGGMAYLVLLAAVSLWGDLPSAWATGIIAAVAVSSVLLTSSRLRRLIESRVEELFFPHHRQARLELRRAANDLRHLVDPEDAPGVIRQAVASVVGGSSLRIVVSTETGLSDLLRRDQRSVIPTHSFPALRIVLDADRPIDFSVTNEGAELSKAIEALQKLDIALVVPFHPDESQARGALLLGSRPGSQPYELIHWEFLETLASQSALALERAQLWQELNTLRQSVDDSGVRNQPEASPHFEEIIGAKTGLREAISIAENVAPTTVVVLIEGETGSGKELIAKAIHAASDRADSPLIKVACAAIPDSLFESEFFGHEKGAFTGATHRKHGRFALADGGTLFLDDVDALSLRAQAKLLRATQDGEMTRLGSTEPEFVDVRIVSATNKDLAAEVRAGRFREDLYYRLNVVPIPIPPLRERRQDLPALVNHLTRIESARYGRQISRVHPKMLAEIQAYDWPGNVRELRNVIERAVLLSRTEVLELTGQLGPQDALKSASTHPPEIEPGTSLDQLVDHFKRDIVERALKQSDGNHRRAAALLGIHRSSLTRMLNRLSRKTSIVTSGVDA